MLSTVNVADYFSPLRISATVTTHVILNVAAGNEKNCITFFHATKSLLLGLIAKD